MSEVNDNSSSLDNIHPESKTLIEGTPFTQINNLVINHIKNGDAFLVWCYLYSKSTNWKTIKQNIKNVYGFGDVKINKIFSYLNRAKLIEYVQGKCAKGQFTHVQIRVLNGSKFDKTQSWIDSAPHTPKTVGAVKCTDGNDELLNKENTKERKEHNNKSNSATDVAQQKANDDAFENYWKINPIKKNRVRAKSIWDKKKLYKIETVICADILNRLENDCQWQNRQYIPHPSTYLHNELWNDEITINELKTSNSKIKGSDSLSRVINKHLNKGNVYDHCTGNTIDPLR